MSTDYFKPNNNKLLKNKNWLSKALEAGDLTLIRLDLFIPANFNGNLFWHEKNFIIFFSKFIRSVNRSQYLVEEAYVGGIFSKEWAPRSGWHCHCLLAFRKRKVKNAWPLAEHVNHLWIRQLERYDDRPLNHHHFIQQLHTPDESSIFHLSSADPTDSREEWKSTGKHASLYRCLSYLSKPSEYTGLLGRETVTRQKGAWYYLPYSNHTSSLLRAKHLAKLKGEEGLSETIALELKSSVDVYTRSWEALKQLHKPNICRIPVCFWYRLTDFSDWLAMFEITEPRPYFGEARLISGQWYCLLIYADRPSFNIPDIDCFGRITSISPPVNPMLRLKNDWLTIYRSYTGSLTTTQYDYQYHSDPYPRSRC